MPTSSTAGGLSPYQRDRRLTREVLVGVGCYEIQPMPFVAPGALAAAGLPENGVALSNPVDDNESVLRTSLLPGQLRAVAYNQRQPNSDARLFEIGRVFLAPPPGQLLPYEQEHMAVALAGDEAPAAVAVLEVVAQALALPDVELRDAAPPGLHPTRGAEVIVAGQPRGAVGEIDPERLAACGVSGRAAWLQLDLGAVLDGHRAKRRYRPVSKYPPSFVDLSFAVPDGVASAQVEHALRRGSDLLTEVSLFDVYRGPCVADGRSGPAYRPRLQAPDRTLTNVEVAETRQRYIDEAARSLGISLR